MALLTTVVRSQIVRCTVETMTTIAPRPRLRETPPWRPTTHRLSDRVPHPSEATRRSRLSHCTTNQPPRQPFGDFLRSQRWGLLTPRVSPSARRPHRMILHPAEPLFDWASLEDNLSLHTIKDRLAALPDGKLQDSLRT